MEIEGWVWYWWLNGYFWIAPFHPNPWQSLSLKKRHLGNGTPLQYSCLENPMDGGAWWAAVHGVAKSQIWLSDVTFTFHFHALEKNMATHPSILAWRIPGIGEPGGLLSMGLHRVGHDWSDLAVAVATLPKEGIELKCSDNWELCDWSKIILKGGKGIYQIK